MEQSLQEAMRLASIPQIPMALSARGITPPASASASAAPQQSQQQQQQQQNSQQSQAQQPASSGAFPGASPPSVVNSTPIELTSFLRGGTSSAAAAGSQGQQAAAAVAAAVASQGASVPPSASPWWALASPPPSGRFSMSSSMPTLQLPSPPLQPLDPPSPEPTPMMAAAQPAVAAPQPIVAAVPPRSPPPQMTPPRAGGMIVENVEPQLTLSTYKIYKFRPFKLVLTLSSEWRKRMRLTEDGVVKACLNAKCCREGSPEEELRSCSICCQTKRIIEVAFSGAEFKGPELWPDGTERYCFDQCRTNCSSSRDHHRGRLMLKIDKLPGWDAICSAPFVLQAREKQRLGKSSGKGDQAQPVEGGAPFSGQPQQGVPFMPSAVQMAPQQQQQQTQALGQQVPQVDRDTDSPEAPGSGSAYAHSSPTKSPAAQQEPKPIVIEGKCVVRMYYTTKSTEVIDNLARHFQSLLEALPGYSSYTYRVVNGTVLSFSWFDTADHAMASMELAHRYVNNEQGTENLWHCNLRDTGILVLAMMCRSW